jgi:hypothetical protein
MEEARDQLDQGEPPDAAQDEALDRLDDAQDELQQAQQRQDEDLLREKLAKIADLIKGLRDRQARAVEESERIDAGVKKSGKWSRPFLASLGALRDQQRGLAQETEALVEKRFSGLRVFARMVRQSADAMDKAAARIDERREDVLDQLEDRTTYQGDLEEKAGAAVIGRQKLALKRLEQLLEALKPDADMLKAQAREKQSGQPMAGGGAGQSDGIPPLAQLKALRALQADLLERTTAFDKLHPDRSKLDDDAAAELEELGQAQSEIAELFEELALPPTEETKP